MQSRHLRRYYWPRSNNPSQTVCGRRASASCMVWPWLAGKRGLKLKMRSRRSNPHATDRLRSRAHELESSSGGDTEIEICSGIENAAAAPWIADASDGNAGNVIPFTAIPEESSAGLLSAESTEGIASDDATVTFVTGTTAPSERRIDWIQIPSFAW